MNDQELLRNQWKTVAEALGIELHGPFFIHGADGKEYEFSCLLPHFGGGRGMLINHEYVKAAASSAIAAGYTVSSMLPEKHYLPVDPNSYIECLVEWGWSGGGKLIPEWYTDVG